MRILPPAVTQVFDNLPLPLRLTATGMVMVVVFWLWSILMWQGVTKTKTQLTSAIKNTEQAIQATTNELQRLRTTKQLPHKKPLASASALQTLQDILNSRDNIAIQEIKKLPAVAVTKIPFFNHPLRIKLQSDYFAIMQYLQALAKLDQPLFVDSLEYHVLSYPMAEVTLELHTLSREE